MTGVLENRIEYFRTAAPGALILTPEEQVLVLLRDKVHEGSWKKMLQHFGTRMPPDRDIPLVMAMEAYEAQHSICLSRYVTRR